jgi:hypothetical protein
MWRQVEFQRNVQVAAEAELVGEFRKALDRLAWGGLLGRRLAFETLQSLIQALYGLLVLLNALLKCLEIPARFLCRGRFARLSCGCAQVCSPEYNQCT